MADDLPHDAKGGEAWVDILARRSPEGRAVAEQFWQANRDFLLAQAHLMDLIDAGEDYGEAMRAFRIAMNYVDRMQKIVHRMASQ